MLKIALKSYCTSAWPRHACLSRWRRVLQRSSRDIFWSIFPSLLILESILRAVRDCPPLLNVFRPFIMRSIRIVRAAVGRGFSLDGSRIWFSLLRFPMCISLILEIWSNWRNPEACCCFFCDFIPPSNYLHGEMSCKLRLFLHLPSKEDKKENCANRKYGIEKCQGSLLDSFASMNVLLFYELDMRVDIVNDFIP